MKQTVLATYVLVISASGSLQALAQQPAKSNPGEKTPAAPAHAAPDNTRSDKSGCRGANLQV